MKDLLSKFQTVTKHPDGPVKRAATHWKKVLKPHRLDFAKLPDLLKDYLTQALFEKSLNLTFELYSAPDLEKFIAEDDWFPEAAEGLWFIIGNQGSDFVCVSTEHGGVALIPGWSITEKQFVREKRYKSLETFFRGRLKREKEAAKAAAESEKADAEFAASTDPNAVDSSGYTQLMRSIGDLEAMKRELDAGANPDIQANSGAKKTALNLAVQKTHTEGVKLLLEYRPKNFNVNLENKSGDGPTPLCEAVKNSYFDIVQLLVEAGANLETPGYHGQSALQEAVNRENFEIIEYLLKKGADPNTTGGGDLPIMNAIYNLPILKLLLKHGAHPNGVQNHRPLSDLPYLDNALTVLKIFTEADGIDLNDPRDGLLHCGKTPEWTALLCEAGADPNLEHRDGALPLMTVMDATHESEDQHKQNALESAKILLKHGADPNRVGGGRTWKTTALTKVTQKRFFEGMELLLEHGADPNVPEDKNAFQAARQIADKSLAKRALSTLEKAEAD